ncbi:Pyruvate kinase [Posidoniimonas polymericola]|uniref:Pyruvate kinase n=1 Tax=Posidoniimonas polymericola TaxID=2528002 RepID=A0A5C5YI80_9BACT|nr:pyruvate kinase [Posidoniimonas polymericola]TWT74576.1 Pyruvate kinase [Posidoniimonas polymericola]
MQPPRSYRHTKIIATLGPATESPEMLEKLIDAGVDILRLNMAHASREWVINIVKRIREVSDKLDRHVAVMIDIKGPEIRTGDVDGAVELKRGDQLELCTTHDQRPPGDVLRVSVNYKGLPNEVEEGQFVLVDSGLLRLCVVEKGANHIRCEVMTPGVLGSRRHINLPGVHVHLPSLTLKDHEDLAAGVEAGIDLVALSFVRAAGDVEELRRHLTDLGSTARIVSKIEEQAGVRNMVEIIKESDAIMVARGDLGIEIEYPQLPLVQTELVKACQAEGRPVIIATHLLESMINSPMPTRAEISDISNAIREQADAIMLSGETTTGAYPLESIEVFNKVIASIEPSVDYKLNSAIKLREPKAKMLRSAATLAQDLGNSGIVVFTRSGFLAYVLGALRPRGVPIYAFTDREDIFRQLMLPWGVEPFLMPFSDDPEKTIQDALVYLKRKQWCDAGTWLVVITNALAEGQVIDSLQLRQID